MRFTGRAATSAAELRGQPPRQFYQISIPPGLRDVILRYTENSPGEKHSELE
jgi:hypothetical protein